MSLVGGTGSLHLITYSRKDFGNWGIIVSVEAKAGTDTADTHGAQSDSGRIINGEDRPPPNYLRGILKLLISFVTSKG